MKRTWLGCYLLFISPCCCAEALFAACILMREKGGGGCVTLCYITQCARPSLSPLPQTERHTAERVRGSDQEGEDGGRKRVLVLMRSI